MLKTNSKKARENIKTYIINHFDGYSYDIETPETFEEVAVIIWEAFTNEKAKYDRRRMTKAELFEEWLSGLPSIFDSCYYYNRPALDDLGEILEETEAERNKYTEADAERRLTYLIYREITKAVENNQRKQLENLTSYAQEHREEAREAAHSETRTA